MINITHTHINRVKKIPALLQMLLVQQKQLYISDKCGYAPESNRRWRDECSGVCFQGCKPQQTAHTVSLHALQTA